MMVLEDFRPMPEELSLTEGMPEQVAIGFIRARRKDQLQRSRSWANYLSNHPRGFA